MTNSGDSSSNKSQAEKQAIPQTQSETKVGEATSSSSSQHMPTSTELGRRTFVSPFPPPPSPSPPLRPRATLPSPPTRPQAVGGGGSSGKGSTSIPMGLGGGIQVGGSVGSSAATHHHHEVGGPSRPKRKAAEIVAPAGVEPICSVCRRDFGSWKALFGHMRSHPERQWRGCFPPPAMQQPTQGDQGPRAQGVRSSSEGSQMALLNIDLNQPQEGETTSASSASNKVEASGTFDLNMPPASDDDQDSGAAT